MAHAVVGMMQKLETLFDYKVCHITLIDWNGVKWVRLGEGVDQIGTEF